MPEFRGFFEPQPVSTNTVYEDAEKVAYVGCVHGGNDRFMKSLAELQGTYAPNHLIFMGDLTGSPEMEELKRRFYNCTLHDTERRRDSYLTLHEYELRLEGNSDSEIQKYLAGLPDDEVASRVQALKNFPYFGDWVSSLCREVRQAVLGALGQNAERLLSSIDALRKNGTQITIIPGNWDGIHSGIYQIAGRDIIPFDTMRFFRERSLRCVDELAVLETDSTFHILLPYDVLLEPEGIQETRLCDTEKRVAEARSCGKAIIMAGHAEANWRVHTLPLGNLAPTQPDRIRSIGNFGKLMARIRPDQVVYPHQHDRIVDEMRREVSLNAKYVLESNERGDNVDLVENPIDIGARPHQMLVTYVPLRHIATGSFSKRVGQNVFDGSQEPIFVHNR